MINLTDNETMGLVIYIYILLKITILTHGS